MNILKINNSTGVYYFGRKKEFNVLELISEFTETTDEKVVIESGLIKIEDSHEFFKYLINREEFVKMEIESIQTISVRKE